MELNHYGSLPSDDPHGFDQEDKEMHFHTDSGGYCHFLSKDYKLARLDLIEACELDSSSALYFYNRECGTSYKMRLNDAIKRGAAAIRRKPEYAEPYINRGHIYLTRNKLHSPSAILIRH